MTNLKTITESLRVAVDAGDLGGISSGVAALERLLTGRHVKGEMPKLIAKLRQRGILFILNRDDECYRGGGTDTDVAQLCVSTLEQLCIECSLDLPTWLRDLASTLESRETFRGRLLSDDD